MYSFNSFDNCTTEITGLSAGERKVANTNITISCNAGDYFIISTSDRNSWTQTLTVVSGMEILSRDVQASTDVVHYMWCVKATASSMVYQCSVLHLIYKINFASQLSVQPNMW